MTHSEINALLDYNYWARDRLLAGLDLMKSDELNRASGGGFPSILSTAIHIYAAERVWCSRWKGESPSSLVTADLFPNVLILRGAWMETEYALREFLDGLGEDGLDYKFEYKMLNGDAASALFSHSIQHMVNHGSYHRGQITTMIRQAGGFRLRARISSPFIASKDSCIVFHQLHEAQGTTKVTKLNPARFK